MQFVKGCLTMRLRHFRCTNLARRVAAAIARLNSTIPSAARADALCQLSRFTGT